MKYNLNLNNYILNCIIKKGYHSVENEYYL